jgi:biotin carboxylase
MTRAAQNEHTHLIEWSRLARIDGFRSMKALCLGGSQWQADVIRRARELGLETLVADIDPGCPGRAAGDEFVQLDTDDAEALVELARARRVDLVLAEQTDRVVPVAAQINAELGLPGLRPDVAERFTDKSVMRRALQGAVPMPAYQEVSRREEALAFAEREGYPVVLKPKRRQSSIGVFVAESPDVLAARFADSVSESQDGRILVESFIDGPEIAVEGFSLKGRFHALAVSEKSQYDFNPCLDRRVSFPPRYSDAVLARIRATARTVVESLGLEDGISHAEYRMRDDVPYLVEVAARGAGHGVASRLVPHVSGVDVYELLIRRLCGEEVVMPAIRHRAASLAFLDFSSGMVREVLGLEHARAEDLAQELRLSFTAGDTIDVPTDGRRRLGYAIVLGENRDEVDAKCARIEDLVRVTYA